MQTYNFVNTNKNEKPVLKKFRSKSNMATEAQKIMSEKMITSHLMKCNSIHSLDKECTFNPTINKGLPPIKSARLKIHKSLYSKLDYY